MKARKAIKAIAALGAGITMVGATILGAMAADLSAYPAPFVKSGAFDGLIVVGDAAAAEDVVGAIDIGTSLQYAMRQTASSVSGLPVVTISDGKKIEKTGDKLNYGDNMSDIISVLDNEDLPVILADGRYQDSEGETTNDEKYTQTLRLYQDAGTFLFATDDEPTKVSADYLFFNDGTQDNAYNYTLEFDAPIEYTSTAADTPAEDLEDTVLKIQGNDYTITDVKYTSTYTIDKLTLLAGETIIWLQQGKTLTRTIAGVEHEIEVTDVNDAEDMCGVSVDGDVVWIKMHQTQTINGVAIGVTDAVAVHAQLQDTDICKINVGATEIILHDSDEVEVNAKDIDGSNVWLQNSTGLASIQIAWIPDDKEYLPVGSSLADPVFGNFEYKFASVSKKTEAMSLTTSTDSAEFTFINNDGKEVEIPYYNNATTTTGATGATVVMGDDYSLLDCDGRLLLEGENCDSTGTDKSAIEGVKFLLVTSGKEAHVMQIGSIGSDNKTTIKDVTYGKNYEDKLLNLSTGGYSSSSISLGSLGTISIGINVAAGTFNASSVNLQALKTIETKYGANLTFSPTYGGGVAFNAAGNNGTILIGEETDESNAYRWNLSMTYYPTDDELRILAPTLTAAPTVGTIATALSASKADRDTKYYVTEWGTKATYDSDNDNSLDIEYPDEQVFANVFIAPIGATVSGAGGESSTVTLNPINVGSAKLASEVISGGVVVDSNLILIGGPCANEAAKIIMGATEDCTAGFESGKAMVKLYDHGSKVAMVVAGMSAADTRRATTVVAKYADYAGKLTGAEVVVSGTSMSDITVSAPSS